LLRYPPPGIDRTNVLQIAAFVKVFRNRNRRISWADLNEFDAIA
jgi:hypothetical protein